MAVSAINAYQSGYYTSAASTGNQLASPAASTASGGDSFQLSSASSGGSSSSTCPRSNSTCIGCGSCEKSALDAASGTNNTTGSQATSYETLQAISAYESQSRYF